jgi:hypothetical protein
MTPQFIGGRFFFEWNKSRLTVRAKTFFTYYNSDSVQRKDENLIPFWKMVNLLTSSTV